MSKRLCCNGYQPNLTDAGHSTSTNSKRMLIEEMSPEHLRLFMDISEEAKHEKAGRPPISKLLYWWGRKPLIVSRAIALLSTTPADSAYSLNAIRYKLGLSNSNGKRAFNYKPPTEGSPAKIKVLDPFGGGGNLLFESARLGFNCSSIDCNPVAYLLLKATLEYPAKYGERLADDVRRYGIEVIKRAKAKMARFYYKRGAKTLAYIWCWCIICPHCGQRVPLTNRIWLDRKHKIGYKIKPTSNKNFVIELKRLHSEKEVEYTQKGGKAVCINCHKSISHEAMTGDIARRRDKELIITITKGNGNWKVFELASNEDKEAFNAAKEELLNQWDLLLANNLIPLEEFKASELRRATSYGLKHWYEFFNERQLLLFITLVRTIREVINELLNKISDKEYVKAIATYLAILVCKHVNRNCIGIGLDAHGKVIHALAFRSPRIMHDFAEINPFEDFAGSLSGMLKNVVDAIRFASNNLNNNNVANIKLGSVCRLDDYPKPDSGKFDLVITDPPYYDDIPYGEASEFFYVWLVRILKDLYPELPTNVPIDEDLIYNKGRFDGNAELATEFYKKGMATAFQNIYKVLDDDGLFVVFYAHSSIEAWNLLLEILREARFNVVSSFTLHTESEESVIAKDRVSFMSSMVLVCRKVLDYE